MLTPSLAEELHAKGFPLDRPIMVDGTLMNMPTLHALVEACGDGFDTLELWGMAGSGSENTWRVRTPKYDYLYGRTADEAVARLWLALNT